MEEKFEDTSYIGENLFWKTWSFNFRVPHQVGSRVVSDSKPFERIRLRIISSGNEWQAETFGPKQEQEHKPHASLKQKLIYIFVWEFHPAKRNTTAAAAIMTLQASSLYTIGVPSLTIPLPRRSLPKIRAMGKKIITNTYQFDVIEYLFYFSFVSPLVLFL